MFEILVLFLLVNFLGCLECVYLFVVLFLFVYIYIGIYFLKKFFMENESEIIINEMNSDKM